MLLRTLSFIYLFCLNVYVYLFTLCHFIFISIHFLMFFNPDVCATSTHATELSSHNTTIIYFKFRLTEFSNFGCDISKGSLCQVIQRSHQLSLCRVAALQSLLIDIVLLILHFLWDCRVQHVHVFGDRVAINPGLGSVRDVASTHYLS